MVKSCWWPHENVTIFLLKRGFLWGMYFHLNKADREKGIKLILLRESGAGFRWNMIISKIERRCSFTNEIKEIKEVIIIRIKWNKKNRIKQCNKKYYYFFLWQWHEHSLTYLFNKVYNLILKCLELFKYVWWRKINSK